MSLTVRLRLSVATNQDGGAARPVALEHDFVDLPAFELARTAHDGALDVVRGHADRFRRHDGRAQPRIHVRIAAAASRNHDFLNEAREVFPRFASKAAFLCLMVAHLECPDIANL